VPVIPYEPKPKDDKGAQLRKALQELVTDEVRCMSEAHNLLLAAGQAVIAVHDGVPKVPVSEPEWASFDRTYQAAITQLRQAVARAEELMP
jgi:hypothetical protein